MIEKCHICNLLIFISGAFCLRNLELSKRQLLLFSQIALVDIVTVRITAIEVIFDLLMWYGVNAFTDQDSNLETMYELITCFHEFETDFFHEIFFVFFF